MSDAYRDELTSLHARAEKLEEDLARRDAEIDELRRRMSERDGPRRWVTLTAMAAFGIALSGAWIATALGRPAKAAPPPGPPAVKSPLRDPCEKMGVHLNVAGEDADALVSGDRDLAGHKYRRDGSRSPWFTVWGGPIDVHAYGSDQSGDLGTGKLTLLTIATKGEQGGYTLAKDGRSMIEVTVSDGKRIAGRFEADVSKVADTTREPPFGTPVVRARGTFCLPALAADPKDTGP